MPDTAYGAPQASTGGGIGGYFAEHPWAKWVALGGVAALAYVLWRRHAQNAATVSQSDTGTTATTTGVPGYIDPTTGLPYGVGGTNMGQLGSPSTNIDDWVRNALSYLTAQGVDPLQAENALSDWLGGKSLSTAEQNIISKALQGIGQAPGGPYPIVPVITPPAPPAQGATLNPVTWVYNVLAPATIGAGLGLLQNMGIVGQRGGFKTPPLGAALYARVKDAKGHWEWLRISNFSQYAHLPAGTQIAYLIGSGKAAA